MRVRVNAPLFPVEGVLILLNPGSVLHFEGGLGGAIESWPRRVNLSFLKDATLALVLRDCNATFFVSVD